ncbi:MAG: hypothetical protein KGI73_04740, partial [Patescibacteria group bacterium]|nr:hypothetical protein [Patescibacteria group bacterium]
MASSSESAATTTSIISPTITTTFGGELLLGLGGTADNTSSTFTAGNGFTLRLQGPTSTPYERSFLEDMISGAQGNYAATASATVADYWEGMIAAFSATSTSCTANGNCYIVSGGTGLQNGIDWNNALPDLPAALTCGTNYFLAGGAYNYTASSTIKTWTTNCTSASPVNIYKAVAGGTGRPDQVAGWQASYGTGQAVFSQTADSDPEKLYGPFFNFCGNYYTLDGIVPASGTPSSSAAYGIVLKSQNDGYGFIEIGGVGYCSSQQPSNITIRHVEFNGVSDPYGVSIVSGTRSSNTVTLTLATTSPWVVGDKINVYNASTTDFNIESAASGTAITSVTGAQIAYTQSGLNETMATTSLTYAVDSTGAWRAAVYAPLSPPVSNVTVSDSYIHDVGEGLAEITCNTCHFDRNYVARNFGTRANHSQAISINASSTNMYFDDSVWEDIQGTSIVNSTGNLGYPVTTNGFYYYNNLSFCTKASLANPTPSYVSTPVGGIDTALSPQCGVSSDISDDNGANINLNTYLYGNTFANTATGHCGAEFDNTSSIATMENNLYYGCPGTSVRFYAGSSTVEAYNSVIYSSSTFAAAGTGDFFTATGTDPFANDSDTTKNFALFSETIDPHLNDGTTLASPYNFDLAGIMRSIDGSWDRGAYEYNTGTLPGTPGTPTFSSVTSSSLSVSWTSASSTNYYDLERATSSGSFVQIATTTSLSYNDTGFAGGTTLLYRLRGANGNGNGSYTASSSATTVASEYFLAPLTGSDTNNGAASSTPFGTMRGLMLSGGVSPNSGTATSTTGMTFNSEVQITLGNGAVITIPSGTVMNVSSTEDFTGMTATSSVSVSDIPSGYKNLGAASMGFSSVSMSASQAVTIQIPVDSSYNGDTL